MSIRKYRKLVKIAEEYYFQGNFNDAIEVFEKAFVYRIEVDDFLTYGFSKLELNNFNEAEMVFKDILENDKHPTALYGLALINTSLGRPQEALRIYEEMIEDGIDDSVIFLNAAFIYDDIKQIEKANEYYLKSVELGGDVFWPYTNVGSNYESMNENQLALEYFLKAYAIKPEEKIISYNLGVIYGKLGKFDLAIKHYLEDLDKPEHGQKTYYNLGLAYKDGYNDLEKAKYYYLLGLHEDQENHMIWYNLGCVYALMEKYNDAYECFLYIKYKANNIFNSIKTDNELVEFRKTELYQKIIG